MNIGKVMEHYDHARAKHPIFCDCLTHWDTPSETAGQLRVARNMLQRATENGNVSAFEEVLMCELYEFVDALANGDNEAAIEELYDSAAVALRMIDVIEGTQKLGRNVYTANAQDRTIERIVRDAIISYQEEYVKAPNDQTEKEIQRRAEVANKWLVDHGFAEEPATWSKEEYPCL